MSRAHAHDVSCKVCISVLIPNSRKRFINLILCPDFDVYLVIVMPLMICGPFFSRWIVGFVRVCSFLRLVSIGILRFQCYDFK